MKNKSIKKIIIIILNIIGIICLIYFLIPYLRHDMSITNPNAMISSYSYDSCGFILILGLIPLIIANILAYKYLDINNKLKLLFFIPSLICLITVGHYLLIESNFNDEEVKETVTSIKCELNGEVYEYNIYFENNEYSLGMDEHDNLPLSVVDYTSIDSITNSIENYYKKHGGSCP